MSVRKQHHDVLPVELADGHPVLLHGVFEHRLVADRGHQLVEMIDLFLAKEEIYFGAISLLSYPLQK